MWGAAPRLSASEVFSQAAYGHMRRRCSGAQSLSESEMVYDFALASPLPFQINSIIRCLHDVGSNLNTLPSPGVRVDRSSDWH